MDTLEIIRELERDEALRAQLRSVILGDEFLSMPEQLRSLMAAVKELIEAQKHTDERAGRLENAVAELIEAQKHTDERAGRLENAVAELIEASKRHETRLNRLDEILGIDTKLVAQEALLEAAEEAGYVLQGEPYGVDLVKGELDVVAQAEKNGQQFILICEAKTRLRGVHVRSFARYLRDPKVQDQLDDLGFTGEVVAYMFARRAYHNAATVAEELGIKLITMGYTVP